MSEKPLFGVPRVRRIDRQDGSVLLESEELLNAYPKSLVEMLRTWADVDSESTLVAERALDGTWTHCSYGQALSSANAIGQALLERGVSATNPLMILSDNSIGNLLMTLGALTVGIPVVPISVAYSLRSHDHARIRAIHELVRPGAVYVEDVEIYNNALSALGDGITVIAKRHVQDRDSLAALIETKAGADVENAYASVTGETVAKILFTSGSTGAPKGVVNTQEMLCANQQMILQVWP
ncbi:MAG: AMP-binding protein, partial [Actinomycetota bacterium]|nr:AMP-binding protein [Actinomycetota bacterium]